jgi:hypothetical protein
MMLWRVNLWLSTYVTPDPWNEDPQSLATEGPEDLVAEEKGKERISKSGEDQRLHLEVKK